MFVIAVYDFEEKRVAKALKICRKYLTWVRILSLKVRLLKAI